jgi:hypothetical protein
MKTFLLAFTVIASMVSSTTKAQTAPTLDAKLLNHMDLSLTAGTTGLGFDLSMPVGDYVKVRTGFGAMLRFDLPTTFSIQVGDDPATSTSKFNRLSTRLSSITGKPVNSKVEVIRQMTFWNWNVLVDIYPFKQNKHWHVTGGFYWGPSKVAEAYNATEAMPTLMAVNIYNRYYDKLHGLTPIELMDIQLVDLGEDFREFSNDPVLLMTLQEKFDRNGRMGVNMGSYKHDIVDEAGNVIHKMGENYLLEPDDNSMVKATMEVNSFKPYVGIGYDGRLVKNNDRYHIGFDCGVMFWGGTPHLKTHDGTDLIHDVYNIPGKIGTDVRTIKQVKVFPVLNLRLTRRLF